MRSWAPRAFRAKRALALEAATLAVLAVLFLSTFVRATFGFGDAVVAMPLLVLLVGAATAAPLVGMVAVTISVTILWSSWKEIAWGATWRLILAAAAGTPAGLLLLKAAPEALVERLLGGVLVGYAVLRLLRPTGLHLAGEGWAWPFGFLAGALGSAYNTNGPPVVLYGTLRKWEPGRFRVTLQSFLLPSGLLIAASHLVGGLWTPRVLTLYALALPGVFLAVALGSRLHRRIPPGRFDPLLYWLLILLGAALLV